MNGEREFNRTSLVLNRDGQAVPLELSLGIITSLDLSWGRFMAGAVGRARD